MIFSARIWQKVVHHYFLVWCWRLKLPVTSSMSPDYDIVTLLYKWDSRHGAIISCASWISWPQAGLWPTCYPPGTPRGHSKVLRTQLNGSRIAPGICLSKHPTWNSWSSRQVLPQFLYLYLSVPCLFIQMVLLDPINVPLGPKKKWRGAITVLLAAYGLLRRFGSSRKKDKNGVLSV